MVIIFLDCFGSDPSKLDQTHKFGEQTSRILEFKPDSGCLISSYIKNTARAVIRLCNPLEIKICSNGSNILTLNGLGYQFTSWSHISVWCFLHLFSVDSDS